MNTRLKKRCYETIGSRGKLRLKPFWYEVYAFRLLWLEVIEAIASSGSFFILIS